MSFDTSRYRFDPWKNYAGVVMQQGRVQIDSDWNDWLAQLSRRIQAGTLDTMGRAAYPATTPHAFELSFDGSGKLRIGPGRMYVDGLLAENHGDPTTAVWDSALAELSNTPLPAASSSATGSTPFDQQPWYSPIDPTMAQPANGGVALAYLDVWTRAVDSLQDPSLVEQAVGVDTTGRLQTVWQLRFAPIQSGTTTCAAAGSPWPGDSAGRLTTAPVNSAPAGPCCLTSNTGYTGQENQHYRVEIHVGGPIGTATFKWSRDNASVETSVTGIIAVTNSVLASASQLTVTSMGRDQVLGFHPGDWIEIIDDQLELAGQPGELHRIDTIDFAGRTITLDSPVSSTSFPAPNNQTDPERHVRIRRWDQSGKVYQSDGTTVVTDLGATGSTGQIPVPTAGTTVILENGITVTFNLDAAGGVFNPGDFWTFAARTDGSIEQLTDAPPQGIHHHYTPVAVVDFSAGTIVSDCRTPWNPGGEECGCCTVTVGDGIESIGQYTSINDAIGALPTRGGEVCILPGRFYEYVFLQGLHDVVVRGCGYHTRLCSPTLAPAPPIEIEIDRNSAATDKQNSNPTGGNVDGTFNAIISVTACQHIQFRNFAVEAADDEVGILLDGMGKLISNPVDATGVISVKARSELLRLPIVIDITIHDLFLTGSTLPAILAQRVQLLRIDDNRILMQNVASLWPSVFVNGIEMHLDRNYVGIQTTANMSRWLPTAVMNDLESASNNTRSESTDSAAVFSTNSKVPMHMGGILIGGPSRSVFVCENQIEGGRFNGITLGSYAIVDKDGIDTNRLIGIRTVHEDNCSTTVTFEPPHSGTTGVQNSSVVASGELLDIVIDRNRITGMGLCGIGPIGFFDMAQIFEVISIRNLTITNNIIRETLQRATATINTFGTAASTNAATGASAYLSANSSNSNPYGAVSVPSVEGLIIRDNVITDFGARPGLKVNGIYVLNSEMVDISRNQVLDTRDWDAASIESITPSTAIHGGIILGLITPPLVNGSASIASQETSAAGAFLATNVARPVYQPGMPALRVEENVVRVPIGQALVAIGFGPFAISNNHFSTGGLIRGTQGTVLAQTVLIMNLGAAIESAVDTKFSGVYSSAKDQATNTSFYSSSAVGQSSLRLATSPTGTITFSNNICQLETRIERQHALSSVLVLSLDHVTFTGNHCWIDAPAGTLATVASKGILMDALVCGGSVNVTGNRFQESPLSVLISGLTIGIANITSQNIATSCLIVLANPSLKIDTPNIVLMNAANSDYCGRFASLLNK